MKIGIFGDVHANLPALQKVVATLKKKCDKLFCTGDVVGYGPQPGECIDFLRKNKIQTVCGNHDEYTLLGVNGTSMNSVAREVIEWTQRVLSYDQKKWLAELPNVIKVQKKFEIVHASHVPTKRWFYVVDDRSANENFKYQKSEVTFFGHTHFPMLASFNDGMMPRVSKLKSKCKLVGGDKYLVNVGSVGQPRDNNNKSACVIFDTKTYEVELLRVDYDRKSVMDMMRKIGFSDFLINRLEQGR